MMMAISKEIIVPLVIVVLVAAHSVQCDPDAGDTSTALSDASPGHDVMSSNTIGRESRQMPELFSKDDIRKFLITLRTFVMGVRNFAEALGGFVPNDQISEKNAMISKYGGLFNTVRIVSNAAQYVAQFLEDLLMREIEDNNDGRQASVSPSPSAVIRPFVSSLRLMQNVAAQIITAYNYYGPEISYSSCMRKFALKAYPNVMSAITLPNTVRALSVAYQFTSTYFSRLLSETNANDQQNSSIDLSNFDDNNLSNEIYENSQQSKGFGRQEGMYNKFTRSEIRKKSVNSRFDHSTFERTPMRASSFAGPRQLGNVELPSLSGLSNIQLPNGLPSLDNVQLLNGLPSLSSIFNFDNAVADQLGVPQNNTNLGGDSSASPSFTRCTQNYALQVFWRIVQSFIMAEDWKLG